MAEVFETRNLVKPSLIPMPEVKLLLKERIDRYLELTKEPVLSESDPIYKLFEVEAVREAVKRNEDNEKISQNFVAFATGSNLDALGDLIGISRDESEDDEAYRLRITSGFDGLSTAGSPAGYIYHAKNVPIPEGSTFSRSDIVDVFPYRDVLQPSGFPTIRVSVVLREGLSSTQKDDLLKLIDERLQSDDVRPVTDKVVTSQVSVIYLKIRPKIYTYGVVPEELIRAKIAEVFPVYQRRQYRAYEPFRVSAATSQLFVDGVKNVELTLERFNEPGRWERLETKDMIVNKSEAVFAVLEANYQVIEDAREVERD